MYNLILKEFLVQKKTFIYGLAYTLLAAFFFKDLVPDGGVIYTIAPIAVIYLFVNYSCGYDDKNKADVIFNSLPISRRDIVLSKYISIFFFAAYGIICSALLGFIIIKMGLPYVTRPIFLRDAVTVLVCGFLFGSVFYPLYFKFGMVKMRILYIFVFMIIMFLPSMIGEYVASHQDNSAVKYVNQFITDTPGWIIRALISAVILIAVLTSVCISMKIYRNREF